MDRLFICIIVIWKREIRALVLLCILCLVPQPVQVNITEQTLNSTPQRIPADTHHIDESKICEQAKYIVRGLLDAGYQAYLVGGCVRDLLLGIVPKDFDVATNAHPHEICDLFENSRLIGRRFQIVHVYFRRDYIEVSTFRALTKPSHSNTSTELTNGRIIRDNTFGSIEEDAFRRDFTVNAMYYDLEHSEVLDFCNGLQDITNRCLRMIGDAEVRYREDPVRMLRALRFRAKLNLDLATDTAAPIITMGHLLTEVSPARLFDEIIKLFHSGYAMNCFHELEQYKLLEKLLPLTYRALKNDQEFRVFIYSALENTDLRIAEGKSVNPAFVFAVFLWKPYTKLLNEYKHQGIRYSEGLWEAGRNTVIHQSSITSIPKRFSITICEIWKLQNRFGRKRGHKVLQFMQHPRFRAAYDFMCLRTQAGELDPDECTWWTKLQEAPPAEQRRMTKPDNKTRRKHNKSKQSQ